jgi:hypothetical protein
MPTVRTFVSASLREIGVLGVGQTLSPAQGSVGLEYAQFLLDSWQTQRLALAVQARTPFTLTSGTSAVTLGPSGADVMIAPTPVWLDTVNYVNPGSSPEQEVPIGQMDPDTYANLSIKELSSALPLQCFYQRSNSTGLGTLFFWPQVSQNVDIVVYSPQGVGVPTSLDTVITGPTGFGYAFMLDLAFNLCAPNGVEPQDTLMSKRSAAIEAFQNPNVQPGTLGVDPALTQGSGAGYNILSDVIQASR